MELAPWHWVLLFQSWIASQIAMYRLVLRKNWSLTALHNTLWWTNIAMENGHWNSGFFPLKMVIFHCYVSSPEGKPGAMGVLECETYFGWPSHELLRREIYRCSKWWTSAGPHLQVVTTLGATWRRPRQWPWRKHGQRIGRHGESSLYDGVFFGSREQNMGI